MVEHLTHIRNFQAWMDVLHLTLSNCFMKRSSIDPPHSFIFKFRMDLQHGELEQLHANQPNNTRRFAPDALDVFCITKHFMASVVAEPPVLCLPNERFGRLSPAPAGSCYKSKPMTTDRQEHLLQLADRLEQFTKDWAMDHSYLRAADDLRNLAKGRDEHVSRDGFLERSSALRQLPIPRSTNPYFGNLPNMSWRMHVSFGR